MTISNKLFILSLCAIASLVFALNAKAATLSQTSVSVSVGQTSTVYASNVLTALYVASNSNPSIASVSIVGSTINIYGSTTGNTVATICDNTSICNAIYITVGGNSSYYGTLSLSQTSLSLSIGQTSNITAYNNYGTLYISSNSNPSVATASVVGNSVSVYGNSTGTSTLSVCQSYNTTSCGTVYITVGGYGYNNGTNSGLTISNITLTTGGSATISSAINSGLGLYVSSNSNPNIVSAGAASGLVNGCTAGALYSVTTGLPCNNYNGSIYSSSYIPGCYAGDLYSITTGQLCSGVVNNSNNGSITISAIAPGADTLTVCQSGGLNNCSTMYVTVVGYTAVPIGYNTPTTYNNSGIPTVYSNSSAN